MRERIFQQCLSASIRMILPPPKFLDAMPERGTSKPRRSTFPHQTYPAAFAPRTRCRVTTFGSCLIEGNSNRQTPIAKTCNLTVELLYIQLLRELYPDQQECGLFPADCHFFLE